MDLDDTLFPTSDFRKYFNTTSGLFQLSKQASILICELDQTIYNFLKLHLHYVRFRIITRANISWATETLRHLPNLNRLVAWNYIPIHECGNMSKFTRLVHILSTEKAGETYMYVGDSQDDVKSVHLAIDCLKINARVRTLQFISVPSVHDLINQWSDMHEIYSQMLKDIKANIYLHYVPDDDCKKDKALEEIKEE